MNLDNLDKSQVKQLSESITKAIIEGLQVRSSDRGFGCGRAYVCLTKVPTKVLNAYKQGAERAGLRYIGKAYGAGDRAIYVGYDNSDGRALAQAKAIAEKIQALGLPAYYDGADD